MRHILRLIALACLCVLLSATARADFIGIATDGAPVGNVVRINEVTGAVSVIGSTGLISADGLARDGSGRLFTVGRSGGGGSLYTMDEGTGALNLVAPLLGLSYANGLAFSGSGVLYAVDPGALYTINTTTGQATLVGAFDNPTVQRMEGLAFAPDGTLYGHSRGATGGSLGRLFRIDPLTGRATPVEPGGGSPYNTLAFTPEGRLYGAGLGSFGALDPLTGLGIFGTGRSIVRDVRGMEWIGGSGAQPVPEPATLLLLGTGLAGIGAAVHRRRTGRSR